MESGKHFSLFSQLNSHDYSLTYRAAITGRGEDTITVCWTPLRYAITGKRIDTVKVLLANGCTVDSSLVPLAIRDHQFEVFFLLMEKGCSVHGVDPRTGRTALHFACQGELQKKQHVIDFLIEKNANIFALDKRKYTPFHIAVMKGDLPMMKYLWDRGFCRLTPETTHPLELAFQKSTLNCILFLFEKMENDFEKIKRRVITDLISNDNTKILQEFCKYWKEKKNRKLSELFVFPSDHSLIKSLFSRTTGKFLKEIELEIKNEGSGK
jgi:ankyrin repeat protein